MIRRGWPILLLPLALAACSGGADTNNDTAAADGNGADPALTSALHDQIMVDPQLGQQANGDSVRPPSQPYSGALPSPNVAANSNAVNDGPLMHVPAPVASDRGNCGECQVARESVTLGGLAARQKNARTRGCAAQLQYSARWAGRLPPDLPLYPQAHVTEAAGTEAGSCQLRAVSFSVAAPMSQLLDWYYTKAVRAGYTAEHQVDGNEHILGGTRARDDGAYVLFMTARADGGTDIDLVANNGV